MLPVHISKRPALAVLLAIALLAGCGKKGPLYHPDQPRPPAKSESR
jgi:predicted small lipoprotein YifL